MSQIIRTRIPAFARSRSTSRNFAPTESRLKMYRSRSIDFCAFLQSSSIAVHALLESRKNLYDVGSMVAFFPEGSYYMLCLTNFAISRSSLSGDSFLEPDLYRNFLGSYSWIPVSPILRGTI